MATTRITDVIIPEVYESYTAVNSPEKTNFFESGVIVRNSMLDAKANEGGETVNIPFWKDLDSSVEENLSSSDPAVVATAQKVTTAKQVARKVLMNQWYSNSDVASELAGSDANQHVRNRFGTYWMRRFQKKLIAITKGLFADNVAANSGDMVVNVAAESTGAQTAATKWSRANFTAAVFTMGDASENIKALGVHSAILKQMVDADDIDYIADSQGSLTIPTFMGKRVIVDDGMPVTAGTTSGFKYTTVLYGEGAFGYGEGSAQVPVELKREALQGNGGGVEYIGERKTWMIHPFGYKVVATPAGEGGFTNTELASASTWERVVDRKSVPLAFLVTN